MKKSRVWFGLVLLGTFLPASAGAQTVVPFGTYTGGTSFSTSVTGGLTYVGGGILQLDIANNGPGTLAAIGLINVPAGTVLAGSAPTGWTWDSTQQLGGAGLPGTTWAWLAPKPRPQNGLLPGTGLRSFTFNVGSLDYSSVGFAVHAISGPGGCSTKLGVWNGGRSTNDVGAGNYDDDCVNVPEPGTSGLIATAMAGLAFIASRRRDSLDLEDEEA